MVRKKHNPWPMRIALILSAIICTSVLIWFYNNEELRHQHVTLVIEPEKKSPTDDREDKERDEEEEEKEEPEASKEDLEEVKDHLERKKAEEMKEDLQEMEELKEEMEEMLEAKLEELPEGVEEDLYKQIAEELKRDTEQLRRDVRDERKLVDSREGRFREVDSELDQMRKMNPLEQAGDFTRKARQTAEQLADIEPDNADPDDAESQNDDAPSDRPQQKPLSEEEQERMMELSERAEDIAQRAEQLQTLEDIAKNLIADAEELREDIQAERELVDSQEGRHNAVDKELREMSRMNPLSEGRQFAESAEQVSEQFAQNESQAQETAEAETGEESAGDDLAQESQGDQSAQQQQQAQAGSEQQQQQQQQNQESNQPGEAQPAETALTAAQQEKLREFGDRAKDLAERARELSTTGLMDMLQPGEQLQEFQPQDMAALTPQQLYEYGQQLEENLNLDFSAHQALDLASIAGGNLFETMQAVPHNFVERANLSEQLGQRNPNSISELENYNNALTQAATETGRMRMSTQARVRNAQGRSSEGRQGQQLMQARQAMQQAAQQQGSRGFADYSQMMRQAQVNVSMGGSMGGNHGAENISGDLGSSEHMKQGQMSRNLTRKNPHEIMRQALPGRKFTDDAGRRGWLFLDTWYIIGPWQKENQMFEKPHPPEVEVDLDAQYVGKTVKGKPLTLKWRFLQSNSVRITPYEHTGGSVYFAYTEVYADKPMEVLLAVASDDGAKIWINDMVVHEDTGLSSWRMFEGFRKVHLKQGYNRMLLRLENGPNVAYFSVLLCPVDLAES